MILLVIFTIYFIFIIISIIDFFKYKLYFEIYLSIVGLVITLVMTYYTINNVFR